MEHGCLFKVALRVVLDVAPVLDAKTLLKVAVDPHLTDDISVLGEV